MEGRTYIGTVTSVSPGKRKLRIEMPTSYTAYALSLSVLEIEQRDGATLKCRVSASSAANDGISVTLVAGVPRDTIAQLKKSLIVADTDAVVRDPNRYDMEELVGLSVYDAEGAQVGSVASAFKTRANGMVELKRLDASTIVLPVVPEVVDSVDWLANRLLLKSGVPLDGAIDDDEDKTILA